MKTLLARFVSSLLVLLFVCVPVWATCGGGGGGGGGGMSGTGGGTAENPVVYHVPWKLPDPKAEAIKDGLILYWFPSSAAEMKTAGLGESRDLSLYGKECVTYQLNDARDPNFKTLVGESKLPVVVLANPNGTVLGKLDNKDGKFKIADVEKLVGTEVKARKANADTSLKDAKAKAAAGDKAAAIALYKSVVEQKCMFPDKAKDASKELKKLGAENIGEIAPAPFRSERFGSDRA
jgi:hypothetical protein